MMMRKSSYTLALLLVPLLLFGTGSVRAEGPVRLLKTIPVPVSAANTTGGLYSFDISFVDQSTQTYYLADRSNAVVDVVDAKTGTFDRQISGGFIGVAVVNGVVQSGQSGPNGVVAAFPWLFVTDAPSRVVSIDLRTDTVVSDVSTGGADNFRADELAYDPKDRLLLVMNAKMGQMTPPTLTASAVEIYAVCGKRSVRGDDKTREETQHKLMNEEMAIRAERLSRDLRQDAFIEYR